MRRATATAAAVGLLAWVVGVGAVEADGPSRVEPAPVGFEATIVVEPSSDFRDLYWTGGFEPFVADVDGDGYPDLLSSWGVKWGGDWQTFVFRGRADGTFVPGFPIVIDGYAVAVAVGDVNGDGWPDIVARGRRFDGLRWVGTTIVLSTHHDGPLDIWPRITELTVGDPRTAVIADFTGDGFTDIAVAFEDETIQVFPNTGDVTFGEGVVVARGQVLAAADFDTDGRVDLLPRSFGEFRIRLNEGDGTFRLLGGFGDASGWPTFAVDDLDDDGTLDVLTPTALFTGQGNGERRVPRELPPKEFESWIRALDPTTARVGGALFGGDFNGDGILDRVGSRGGWGNTVSLRRPESGVYEATLVDLGAAAARARLDGADGSWTLAALDDEAGELSVWRPQGTGAFGQIQAVPLRPELAAIQLADDLNADGRTDLLVGPAAGPLALYLQRIDGTLEQTDELLFPGGASAFAAVDIDADGIRDLLASNTWDGIWIARGLGAGKFESPAPWPDAETAASPTAMIGADINGDGRRELVVGCWGFQIAVLHWDGSGGCDAALNHTTSDERIGSLWAADLNGDGIDDLLAAFDSFHPDGNAHSLRGFFGAADGATEIWAAGNGDYGAVFQRGIAYSPSFFTDVAVADFNRDGRPDVAAASGWLHVSLALADGTYSDRNRCTGTGGFLVAADVDGDGWVDLLGGGVGTHLSRNMGVTSAQHVSQPLSDGLNAFVYGGAGTTADQLIAELGPGVELVWAFDAAAQRWRSYAPTLPGSAPLTVGHGQPLFVLWEGDPREHVGPALGAELGQSLPPGLSFVAYGGESSAVDDALATTPGLTHVYRWDPERARWDGWARELPAELNTLRTVSRYDVLFVFNATAAPIVAPW